MQRADRWRQCNPQRDDDGGVDDGGRGGVGAGVAASALEDTCPCGIVWGPPVSVILGTPGAAFDSCFDRPPEDKPPGDDDEDICDISGGTWHRSELRGIESDNDFED